MLNKHHKIYLIISAFIIATIIGCIIEHYDGRTFVLSEPPKMELSQYDEQSKSSNTNLVSKININTATADELCKIKGIGKSKADLIIKYRNKNGKFIVIEDIMEVQSIGQKLFDKIKEQICVD